MGIAKVILNRQTLIDVTQKTVTASTLFSGLTALGRDGENVVGTYIPQAVPMYQSKTVTPTTSMQVVVPDTNMESLNGTGTVDRVSGISISHGGDLSGLVSGQSYRIAVTLNCYKMGSSYSATWNVDDEFEWNGSYFDLTSTAPSSIASVYLTSLRLTATTCDFSFASSGSHGADIHGGIYISQPYDALSSVTVNPIPSDYVIPAGTLSVLADGTYDVKSYASVDVSVGGGGPVEPLVETDIYVRDFHDWDSPTVWSANAKLNQAFNSGDVVAFSWAIGNYGGAFSPSETLYESFTYDGASHTFSMTNYSGNYLTLDSSAATFSMIHGGATELEIYKRAYISKADALLGGTMSVYSSPNIYNLNQAAFAYNDTITSVTLDNCITTSASAFARASNLTFVSMPDCEAIGSNSFELCKKLISLYTPNLVSIWNYAFSGCTLLESVMTSNLGYIGVGAFNYCSGITSMELPEASYIGNNAFYGCSNLSMINAPKVKTIGGSAFYGCVSLHSVEAPAVTFVGSYAFNNCRVMESFSFPAASMVGEFAFFGCSSLQTVYLSSARTIGNYAFSGCGKLQYANIAAATSIGVSAFNSCVSLSSIDISSPTYIGDYAFNGCSKLVATIDVSAATTIGIYAFYNCKSLTFTSLVAATSIGGSAFYSCTGLSVVDLPSATSILSYAFHNCRGLLSVNLSAATSIGSNAFNSCVALTYVNAPVVSTIGNYAFSGCLALKEVRFASAGLRLSSFAFYSCNSLESLYLMGSSVAGLYTSVFAFTPMVDSTYLGYYGSIYVPASLLASYRASATWLSFSDRLVGI